MGNGKRAIATSAAILGILAGPILWQRSTAAALREELAELQQARSVAEVEAERVRRLRATARSGGRDARTLLSLSSKPISPQAALDELGMYRSYGDMLARLVARSQLSKVTRQKYEQLLAEIDAFDGDDKAKQRLLSSLSDYAPRGAERETIAALLKVSAAYPAYHKVVGDWAEADPEAALAWFDERSEGDAFLHPKTKRSGEGAVFTALLFGMAKQSPEGAVDLFFERQSGMHNATISRLAEGIGHAMAGGADDTQLRRLADRGANGMVLVACSLEHAMAGRDIEEAVSFIESYLDNEHMRRAMITTHVLNQKHLPVEERAGQLIAHLPTRDQGDAIGSMIAQGIGPRSEADVRSWIEAQPSGIIRDRGWRVMSERAISRGDYPTALAEVGQIESASEHSSAMYQLARRWVPNDPEAARAALPAEIFESVRK